MNTSESTQRKIDAIAGYPLLSRVGDERTDADIVKCRVERVPAWPAFAKLVDDESLQLPLRAYLTNMLGDAVSPLRLGPDRDWRPKSVNAWRRAIGPQLRPMTERVCERLATSDDQRRAAQLMLHWMIVLVAQAEQFRPFVSNIEAFETFDSVLRAGRCVAGWRGRPKDGSLLVF